jgi:hypothetical protein
MTICLSCREKTSNPKFCDRSCAATYNNRVSPKRHAKKSQCKNCGADLPSWRVFCSNAYQCDHRFKTITLPAFFKGQVEGHTLKRCLKATTEYKCDHCGNPGEHQSLPLVLQLEHRDGNHSNNLPSNLGWLCPNCHSQTETFAGKNKPYRWDASGGETSRRQAVA